MGVSPMSPTGVSPVATWGTLMAVLLTGETPVLRSERGFHTRSNRVRPVKVAQNEIANIERGISNNEVKNLAAT